jgi:hypothetical protein
MQLDEFTKRANSQSTTYDFKYCFIIDFLYQVNDLFCVVLRGKPVKIVRRRFSEFCRVNLSISNIRKNLCKFLVVASVESYASLAVKQYFQPPRFAPA